MSSCAATVSISSRSRSAYRPVRRVTRSFAFRAFATNTNKSVPIEAPDTARTVRDSGEDQYARSASPTSSRRLLILLLLRSPFRHLDFQVSKLRSRQRAGVLEEVGYCRAPECVDYTVDHRGHCLSIRSAFADAIKDLLLALLPNGDEALVDQTIQGRRHARVRDIPRLADFVVDGSGARLAEVADRAQHG